MALLRPLVVASPFDLDTLAPCRVINQRVVSAFLRIIERRGIYYPTLPTIWVADGNFLANYRTRGYSGTKEKNDVANIFTRDLLLFPLLLPPYYRHRWSLVVARPAEKLLVAYDPLGKKRAAEMATVLQYLSDIAKIQGMTFNSHEWLIRETPEGTPRIMTYKAAGIWVLAFAELLTKEVSLEGQPIDTRQWRIKISSVLRRQRLDQEDMESLEVQGRDWFRPPVGFQPVNTVSFMVKESDGNESMVYQQDDPTLTKLEQSHWVKGYPGTLFPTPIQKPCEVQKKKLGDEEQPTLLETDNTTWPGLSTFLLDHSNQNTNKMPSRPRQPKKVCRKWRLGDRIIVTDDLLQILEREEQTSSQSTRRKDQRWRVELEDGDHIRLRPNQLRCILNTQGI